MVCWHPLPFREGDLDSLRAEAEAVLLPGARIPAGRSPLRTLSFLAGRAAVARLYRHLGFPGRVTPNPRFGYLVVVDARGTPVPDLFVTISHTPGMAVAAASHRSVGIDVEAADRSVLRALGRVASPEELAEARAARGEVALWSAKEAVSKATGLGIKFGMHAFRVRFAAPAPHPVELGVHGPLPLVEPTVQVRREGPWVVSICAERPQWRTGPVRVSGPELP